MLQSREDPLKRAGKHERYAEVSERKRSSGGTDSRFEAPPPPRFDASLVTSRSYDTKKRDDYSSTAATKRGIDDYTSSSKRMDYTSHGSSAGPKRSAIDDYAVVPTKRSGGDYISGGSSSKRGIDDGYGSSSKTRDDYKRDVEIRHIPSVTGSSIIHKSSSGRYNDTDRTSSTYRRGGGLDDIRSGSSGNKRGGGYDNSSGYVGNSGGGSSVWPSSAIHMTHNSSSLPQLKSYGSNGMSSNMHGSAMWSKPVDDNNWRTVGSTQDRYDRTYNERSSGYPSTGNGGGMYGGGGNRYGGRY